MSFATRDKIDQRFPSTFFLYLFPTQNPDAKLPNKTARSTNVMQESEAILRYSTAKGYIQACKMIFLSVHYAANAVAVILPLHILAAFGLELHLKAWVLKAGVKSQVVRGYGHDLRYLYDEARRFGLPNVEKLEEMRDHFAGPHSDFTYRYIKSGDQMDNTNWPLAFEVFDNLDRQIDAFIGASASYGLEPGH